LFLKESVIANVLPIALNNKWFKPALLQDVLKYEGFSGPQIAETILAQWETRKTEIINVKSLI
ncbi:MAG TPA: hypothetical protein VGK25_10845, partial [Ignavibacteria bacterium]